MRITVCTKRDLPGCVALNHLLPGLAGHRVQVLMSEVDRAGEHSVPELARLKRFERDVPNRALFERLDALEAPPGRLLSFGHLGRRYGLRCRSVREINKGDGLWLLREFAPDLIISVRFSLIFRDEVLSLPRLGVLNVHPGELPRYAGLFSPFWSLLEGQESIGCTVHWIDAGIDTGPVLGLGRLPVDPARSLVWHVAHTYPQGVAALLNVLPEVLAGRTVPSLRQDGRKRCYRSLPGVRDIAAFHDRGLRLIAPGDHRELLGPFTTVETPRAVGPLPVTAAQPPPVTVTAPSSGP
ncbi:formyl transferase [Streptomyces sp. NPDC021093]|uniref:formyl transferase n=1 Tax=Streptomyces sp. NPDC021093 TaxID=3365112 RepID=UPI0037A153D7